MKLRLAVLVLALAAIAIGAGLLSRPGPTDAQLSEAPERRALLPSVPETPSSLQVRLDLPVAAITDALAAVLAEPQRIKGRQNVCANLRETIRSTLEGRVGGDVGRLLGDLADRAAREAKSREVCEDMTYDVTIDSAGAPRVASGEDGLAISLPVAVSGRAGFTGDLARALSLDGKNFRGALEAIARVTVDLDTGWCPVFGVEADFRWIEKAELEVVDGWWIDIDRPAGAELRRRLANAATTLQETVTCETVRTAVAPEWRARALPIGIPGAGGAPAYLHVRPTGAGFSGMDYGAEAIGAAIQVDAVAELRSGTAPETETAPAPLPPLERIAATANRVQISLPLRIGYDALVEALNAALSGRTFSGDGPAGAVDVTVREVTVYPSGDRLAAGLRFEADAGGRMLDVAGWAYLAARPVLDAEAQILRLEDVSLTRQLDNDLWAALSGVFNGEITRRLTEAAVIPLGPAVAGLEDRLADPLAALEAETGLRIGLDDVAVTLTDLVPAADALEAVARFEARAGVLVTRLR